MRSSIAELWRWAVVALFATAMAWVEAAVVFYLRTLVDRIDPFQARPLPVKEDVASAEIVREAATLIMLGCVGWLAGRTWRSRLGYLLVAFGLWDILYYGFLRVMTAWPRSLLDWDVLFLIPLPWWGPVVAPVAIAALMVVGGTMVAVFDLPGRPVWPSRRWLAVNAAGVFVALYVFMADAIRAAPQGKEALRHLLPTQFNWPLFLLALACMAAPLYPLATQIARMRQAPAVPPGEREHWGSRRAAAEGAPDS